MCPILSYQNIATLTPVYQPPKNIQTFVFKVKNRKRKKRCRVHIFGCTNISDGFPECETVIILMRVG